MKKKLSKNRFADVQSLFELDSMFSAVCKYFIRVAPQQLEHEDVIRILKTFADDYEQREIEIKNTEE